MTYLKHFHVSKELELYRMDQGPFYVKIGLPQPFKTLEEAEYYLQQNAAVGEIYEVREITRISMKLEQQ